MGMFHFHCDPAVSMVQKTSGAVKFYGKIPELLKQAKTYSIANLNNQTEAILNILIRQTAEIEAIRTFEIFLESIEKAAGQTGQNLATAKTLLQRSFTYLTRPSSANYLSALSCLHKAKDNCNNDDGRPYLIIVLNNISKVYLDLGMNLAAKYYALTAVWACVHFGDYSALKLAGESYASVFDADFRQGSWISALEDIQNYLYARFEFNADYICLEKDIVFCNALADTAFILSAAPLIHPEINGFIEFQKGKLSWIYAEFMKESSQFLEKEIRDPNKLNHLLQRKLTMPPFSDVGPIRKIEFKTHGIEWSVIFSNEAETCAVGEEFTALFQIILCEIAMLQTDLHLLEMPAAIHVSIADGYSHNLKQRKNHYQAVWDLAIPEINTSDQLQVQLHYAFLATCIKTLLRNISVLPAKEFQYAFDSLYTKQNLGHKGLILNSYQKVYFNLLSPEEFNESRRSAFNAVSFSAFNSEKAGLDISFEGVSEKYNKVSSEEKIRDCYLAAISALSVSLHQWQKDPDFKSIIDSFRSEGYLDWQILYALRNFVIAAKVNMLMHKNLPATQQEAATLAQELTSELQKQPEEENYIPIPLEWLSSSQFSLYLRKLPVDALNNFGLENGMQYPNFAAVHSYLSKRFGFSSDDQPEDSPLKDL